MLFKTVSSSIKEQYNGIFYYVSNTDSDTIENILEVVRRYGKRVHSSDYINIFLCNLDDEQDTWQKVNGKNHTGISIIQKEYIQQKY